MWRLLLGFVLFLSWAGFSRYYYVCKIQDLCGPPPVERVEDLERPKTLSLYAGGKPVLQKHEQFYYDYGSTEPVLNSNNEVFLKEIASIMKQYPSEQLVIKGRYLEEEENGSALLYENLGKQRAAELADKLAQEYGLDRERIALDYQLVDSTTLNAQGALREPLVFSIGALVARRMGLLDSSYVAEQPNETSIQPETSTFYNMTYSNKAATFDYNSAEFKPGRNFEFYADSLRNYLAQHPKDRLLITGHTDSKGDGAGNLKLGKRRAEAVKAYFRKKGLKAPIETATKGESQPIAPNTQPDGSDNPAGREKNRRVNVRILQQ